MRKVRTWATLSCSVCVVFPTLLSIYDWIRKSSLCLLKYKITMMLPDALYVLPSCLYWLQFAKQVLSFASSKWSHEILFGCFWNEDVNPTSFFTPWYHCWMERTAFLQEDYPEKNGDDFVSFTIKLSPSLSIFLTYGKLLYLHLHLSHILLAFDGFGKMNQPLPLDL